MRNIQKSINEVNHSIESNVVGDFFEKSSDSTEEKLLMLKFDDLRDAITDENYALAHEELAMLRAEVIGIKLNEQSDSGVYRAKRFSFEMPILKDGQWCTEVVEVPLCTLFSQLTPKIKSLTLDSLIEHVESDDGEVYINIQEPKHKSLLRYFFNNKSTTKVKIVFSADQSNQALNEAIAHYEKVVTKAY